MLLGYPEAALIFLPGDISAAEILSGGFESEMLLVFRIFVISVQNHDLNHGVLISADVMILICVKLFDPHS